MNGRDHEEHPVEPGHEIGHEPGRDPAKTNPAKRGENDLPAAARRALAEAEERRRRLAAGASSPAEVNGRDGPDPVRYGDWEKKGIAVDF